MDFQYSATGSLTPIIQPRPLLDPVKPDFNSYQFTKGKVLCKDSVYFRHWFWNNWGEDLSEETRTVSCRNAFELPPMFLRLEHEWAASPDLAYIHESPSDCKHWTKVNNSTWKFECHIYGMWGRSIDQTWKLDAKGRIFEVLQHYKKDELKLRLLVFYNSQGKVDRISQTMYDEGYYTDDNHSFTAQVHQQWVYDKQQLVMMIKYNGKLRAFTNQNVKDYRESLASRINMNFTSNRTAFDSLDIRDLVIYNYGKYGVETVNHCHQVVSDEYHPTYYERKYTTDSLFYDSKGHVIRYSCPVSGRGYTNEMLMTYDSLGRLSTLAGRSTYKDNWELEKTVLQWYDYGKDGLISHFKQRRFERTYQRPREHLVPLGQPKGEEQRWYKWGENR